jgi:hypothetical protein
MTQSPEQIEAEIEQTRESIKTDVDALQEKLDPRKAAGRQADRVKESVTSVKDTLMGASSERAEAVSSSVAGTAGAVSQTVSDVPARLRTRTQGNPWAMGLTAFALGWLVSSLLPPSRKEREAAQALRESPAVEPVMESARQVATEAGEHVKQAAATVGEQAQQAAGTVGQHAKESVSAARESVGSR